MKIIFEEENSRAAAYEDTRLVGQCDVVRQKAFWIITHTEVDPAYGGKGIGGELVGCVMEAAKKAGVKVKPFCSYAAHLFAKNAVYAAMEDKSVITVYGMKTCPDCTAVEEQIEGDANFRFVDIGEHVKNMKAFLQYRDADPVFDAVRGKGVGIPCFVLEDGTVTLTPEEVGLYSKPSEGAACRVDGKGC